MKTELTVEKETVTLRVELTPKRVKERATRFYENNARELIQQERPDLVLGACLNNCVIRSGPKPASGSWVFGLVQLVQEQVVVLPVEDKPVLNVLPPAPKNDTSTSKKKTAKSTVDKKKEEVSDDGSTDPSGKPS